MEFRFTLRSALLICTAANVGILLLGHWVLRIFGDAYAANGRAALILMFAFLVLSSSPGFEIKEFAIGLAAGIIFDATVIRALLVPALMRLLGAANWWMPQWTKSLLFIRTPEPPQEVAAENV